MPATRRKVTINCNMGEAFGNYKCGEDELLMPLIDIANVACGFHAGDPTVMQRTVRLAKQHSVLVGAHPSLPDREGFGRRRMDITPAQLFADFSYQIGALAGMLKTEGMELHHVKPHGISFLMIAEDEVLCEAAYRAVKVWGVPVVGLAGTWHEKMAKRLGIEFIPEFYPDVFYGEDGSLTIFTLIDERVTPAQGKEKVTKIIKDDLVTTLAGTEVKVGVANHDFTCCIHSDLKLAVEMAHNVRLAIKEAGCE